MGKNKKSSEEKKSIEVSKPLLISIVVLIVIFIGSFMFFTFMLNSNKSKGNKVAAQQTVEKKELVNLGLGEEFVVNLADQGGKRYIKTNIVVAYNKKNKEFAKVAEEKTIVLRDATINYLKLKTVDETKDTEAIKKGLIDALNKALGSKDVIEDIYFQSLIVQ